MRDLQRLIRASEKKPCDEGPWIFGADRIQLVELGGNGDRVVLQIPYSNFAEVKYEATRSHRRVGIDLLDLNDREPRCAWY